jgi:hypothetical protein
VNDSLHIDDDGVCRIHGGKFGWEFYKFYDAASKVSYAMVWALDYGKEEHREMLKKVIKEETGAKEVEFVEDSSDTYNSHGYIDHQSDGVAADAFESGEILRAFIFNRNSVLETGNDNC